MTVESPSPSQELPRELLPTVADVLRDARGAATTIELAHGLTAHVLERPGRCLTVSAHRRVYRALVPVTTRSFGADMTPYWAQRGKEGYLERLAEFVLVADPVGTIVGWTGWHVLRCDEHVIVYLDSTGMVPEWQSAGVMRSLMRTRLHEGVLADCPTDRPVYLTARSESPVFYRLMRGLLPGGQLYPHPTVPPPADAVRCAEDMAEWLGQRDLLERDTLAIRGAYSGLDTLYGELPTTGDVDLDKLFRSQLGPLDAYLLVARAR